MFLFRVKQQQNEAARREIQFCACLKYPTVHMWMLWMNHTGRADVHFNKVDPHMEHVR